MSNVTELPPNIQRLVDDGKVTYRGCGIHDTDVLLKIGKREVKVTDEKFRELGWIKKIKFSAPFREES